MSIKFEWKEKYSVGNLNIDQQHKGIFEIANSLTEEMNENEIKIILMKLFKYTRVHFADEEEMMKKIGYPKLDEQRELHNELISKLSTLSVKSFDTVQFVINFKKFVYGWITNHILLHDMDYFHYNQKRLTNKT